MRFAADEPKPATGGEVTLYVNDDGAAVERALANAVRKSVVQIDGTSAKELKAGLAEAQAGMSA